MEIFNECLSITLYDLTGISFIGTKVGVGNILGTVKVGTQGLRGVRIWTRNIIGEVVEAYSDVNGNYQLSNLEKTVTYSVYAELYGFTFTDDSPRGIPVPIDVNLRRPSITLNFKATRVASQWGVSGYVKTKTSGIEGARIVITDTSNNIVRETRSFSDGWFYAGGLQGSTSGVTYKITPQFLGYGFNPSDQSVTVTNSDIALTTPFVGYQLTYCISGKVNGSPLEGVVISLQEKASGVTFTTVSASDGSYHFCGLLNGEYYISAEGYYYFGIQPLVIFYQDLYNIDLEQEVMGSMQEVIKEKGERQVNFAENLKASRVDKLNLKVNEGKREQIGTTRESKMNQQQKAISEESPSDVVPKQETSGITYIRYYIFDHLGTARVVTDENGEVVSTHDYEPFGVEIPPFYDSATATDFPSANTHKFTGQERDQNTNYDYMHFRYYSSNIGRFLKPDNVTGSPMNPQNWNLYSYVRGNPVNFNDPTGHQGEETNAKLPQSGGDPNAQVEAKEQIKEEQSENKDKESNKPPQGAGDQAKEFVGPPSPEEYVLANVVYNETSSLRPNPKAEPNEKGSKEDLHAGRVAVAEIANRLITSGHSDWVASSKLTTKTESSIVLGNKEAVAAYADCFSAAIAALAGSNTTEGATQFRIRPNNDTTTNVGADGKKKPGTPVSMSFGPFLDTLPVNKNKEAVIVVAP